MIFSLKGESACSNRTSCGAFSTILARPNSHIRTPRAIRQNLSKPQRFRKGRKRGGARGYLGKICRRRIAQKKFKTPLQLIRMSSARLFFVTSPHRRGKMRHKMHQIMPKTPLQLVRMSSARAFFVVCEAGSSKSRQKLIRNSSAECLRDSPPKNTCQKLLCRLSAHNPPTQKELPRRTF